VLGGLSILLKEESTLQIGTSKCMFKLFIWVLFSCLNMGVVVALVKLLEFVYRIVGISMLLY
jgi:hypothetical protein